jgi:NADP-dependent 3-hydroxy acid dehydrogenase YdfG
MNNSANKVVVITGASSGIGQAIALHLANNAFSLVLVARRLDRINALVDQIIQQGGKAIAVKADVTRQEEVQRAIDAAVAAYQRVDVLINNAGFMAIAPLSELKTDEWDKMIDTNLKGCCTASRPRGRCSSVRAADILLTLPPSRASRCWHLAAWCTAPQNSPSAR